MDGPEIQFLCERNFIHHPWQVSGLNTPFDDGPGDGKTCPVDRHGRLCKKLYRQGLQAGGVGAMYFLLNERSMRACVVREDRQVGSCAAHVPRDETWKL